MNAQPVVFVWDGEAMVPVNGFHARACDRRFVVGERYPLDEVHARSQATHAHYFAVLREVWQSLPDPLSAQFTSPEKLRKYALIRTGYHVKNQHVCKSQAEAYRLAAVIRPYDEYQIVEVDGCVVTVYHAMSQDHRSMDRATFQASKTAVLDWCADLIGVARGSLSEVQESA